MRCFILVHTREDDYENFIIDCRNRIRPLFTHLSTDALYRQYWYADRMIIERTVDLNWSAHPLGQFLLYSLS